MTDETEKSCAVCGKFLTPEHDVVVCSICGAPYHRSCWAQKGCCLYADKHGTDEQWHPPLTRHDEHVTVCGNCGTVNPDTQSQCLKCGRDLREIFAPGPAEQQPPLDANVFYAQFSPYVGMDPESTIEGFPAMDVATFLGPNSGYYLARFHFMNMQHTHTSWNWAAALFPEAWLLYRKMYKLFALVFLVHALLFLPLLIASVTVVQDLLSAYGGDPLAALRSLLAFEGYAAAIPQWTMACTNATISLSCLLRAFMAVWANRFYYKYCIRRIRAVKRVHAEDPLIVRCLLAKTGGINRWSVFLFVVTLCLVFALVSTLILL